LPEARFYQQKFSDLRKFKKISKLPFLQMQKFYQLAAPKNLSEIFSDFQEKCEDIKFFEFVRNLLGTQIFS
jgi:hypothetical protein